MSRLIVKHLPAYVTPEKLRKHFEQKAGPGGLITDVKVSLKQDGTSRRFGFVGYKTEKEAAAAKEWFDRTFIDSARISVAFSEGAKDAPTPRPNKRRRLDPPQLESAPTQDPVPSSSTEPTSKGKGKLDEFMEVMQPKKGPAWANEAHSQPSAPVEETAPAEMSDLDWMRQRMSAKVDQPEKAFEQSDDEEDGLPEKPATTTATTASAASTSAPTPQDVTKQTILSTSRLFVRNLAYSCTDEDLTELFSPFGQISQIHTPLDGNTRQPKGMSYVSFANPQHALAAYEALDKKTFQGRLLHILAAVDRKPQFSIVEGGDGEKKVSVKDERAIKKKAAAGKEFNWGMLYMNADAVASSIAARLSVSKSDILNPDAATGGENGVNPAVKLALAETHVIQETKRYFETEGVNLSSFSSSSSRPQRSKTTILIKNIPYTTTTTLLAELFEPYGPLSRVLLPPSGTLGVVEFEKEEDAKEAFRGVAYRRIGSGVVYLEWAPAGIWDGRKDTAAMDVDVKAPASTPKSKADEPANATAEMQVDQEVEPGTTLYVKNLSFATTQERLSKALKHLEGFGYARVQTKADPAGAAAADRGHGPGRLSMGYGFVGFKDVDSARKALKALQGFEVDGHKLVVKFAGRGAEATPAKDGKEATATGKKTTKMIVKNVPFEASKKDIRELFGSHGSLKSVRLPKNFGSRSRGFAFLDFVSRHEAENAYEALRHTHLLGRHLVLEWANEEEGDIDLLRQKAGVGYGDGGKTMPGRKRKLDLGKTVDDDVELLE